MGTLCSESNGPICSTCGGDELEEKILFCKNSIWSQKWPGCFGAIHLACLPLEDKDEQGKEYLCDPCGMMNRYIAQTQFRATEEDIDFSQIRFDAESADEDKEMEEDPAENLAPCSPSSSGCSSDGGIQRQGKKKLRRLSSDPQRLESLARDPPQNRSNLANRRGSETLQPQPPLSTRRGPQQDPSLMRKMKTVGKNIQPRQRVTKVPKGRALPDDLERVDQVASGTTMLKAGGIKKPRYLDLSGQEPRKNPVPSGRRASKPGPGTGRGGGAKQQLQRAGSLDKQPSSEQLDPGFVPSRSPGGETPPYNAWEDTDPSLEQDPFTATPSLLKEKSTTPFRQPPASWGKPLATSSSQSLDIPASIKPQGSDGDRLNAFKARLGASKATVGPSGGPLVRLSSDLGDWGRGNEGGDDLEVPEECNRLTKAAANESMKRDGRKKEAFNFCSFLNDQLGAEVAQGVIANKRKEEEVFAVHRDHLWNGFITFAGIPELLPHHLEQVGPVSVASVPVFFPVLGCDINSVKKIFDETGKPLRATLRRKFDLEWLIQEDTYKELDKFAQLEVEAPSASCRAQLGLMKKHMEMEELVGCCVSRRHPELDLYLFPGANPSTLVGFVRYNWTGKQVRNAWRGILKKEGSLRKPNHVTFRRKEQPTPAKTSVSDQKKKDGVAPKHPRIPKKIHDQQGPKVSERTGDLMTDLRVKKGTSSQLPPRIRVAEGASRSNATPHPSARGNEPDEMEIEVEPVPPENFPPHLRSQPSQPSSMPLPPPPADSFPPLTHREEFPPFPPHYQPPPPDTDEGYPHFPPHYQPLPPPPPPRGEYPQFPPHYRPPPPPPRRELPPYHHPPPPPPHGDYPPPCRHPPPPPPQQLNPLPPLNGGNSRLAVPEMGDAMAIDNDPYSPREGQNLPLPGQPPLPGSPCPTQASMIPAPPLSYPRMAKDLRFALVGYSGSHEERQIIEHLTKLGAEYIADPHPNTVNLVSFNERLQWTGMEGYFRVCEYLDFEVVFVWGLDELWSSTNPCWPYHIEIRTESMCFPDGVLVVADKFALSSCGRTEIQQIIEGLKEGYRKTPSCLWKLKVSEKCWEDLLKSRDPETMSVLELLWAEKSDPRAPGAAEKVFEFMQPHDQSSSKGKRHPPQVVRDAVKMAFTNRNICRFVYLVHGHVEDVGVKEAAENQNTIQSISIPDLSKKIKWIVEERGSY